MNRFAKIWVLCLLVGGAASQRAPVDVRISSGVAESNLLEKTEPVYPAIARAARVQGTVVLVIEIAADGSVSDARLLSGPPLLVGAATDAVKQWRYSPYKLNGEPVAVQTTVSVPFSLGIPNADYQKEEQASQLYFKQDKQCRAAIAVGHFSEAQTICSEEVKIAEQLPTSREMERESAYGLLGQAFFYDHKFPEALSTFQSELASAKKHLHDDDAEMGYAYRHVAWGLHTTGHSDEALANYQQAEKIMEAAQAKIGSEFLKNEYAKVLKALFREHATLLHQLGRDTEAGVFENKAESITINPTIKDQ